MEQTIMFNKYIVIGMDTCAPCKQVQNILAVQDIEYEYVDMFKDDNLEVISKLLSETNVMAMKTVPQIFGCMDGTPTYIGGFTDFQKHMREAYENR